jgi:hydrogenase maturation protease
MARVLVIGIGNPLRSDDGFGWAVAEQLSARADENLQVLKVHQLTPELAEAISGVDLAIFVDAGAHGTPCPLTCEPVSVSDADLRFSHDVTPAALIQVAQTLYRKAPVAYLVCVAGKSFEHGEALSPQMAAAIPRVMAKVRELMETLHHGGH